MPFGAKWGTLETNPREGGDDMPYEKLRLTAMTTAGG